MPSTSIIRCSEQSRRKVAIDLEIVTIAHRSLYCTWKVVMQIRVSLAGYEVARPQIRPSLATVRMALLIKSHVELPVILAQVLLGERSEWVKGSMWLWCYCGFASLPNWRTLCRRSEGIWMPRRCLTCDLL
jgi:hypothetical protein